VNVLSPPPESAALADPQAILRASSLRTSRARFGGGEAFLLGFFIVLVSSSLA
jgi:hypothetical protein